MSSEVAFDTLVWAENSGGLSEWTALVDALCPNSLIRTVARALEEWSSVM